MEGVSPPPRGGEWGGVKGVTPPPFWGGRGVAPSDGGGLVCAVCREGGGRGGVRGGPCPLLHPPHVPPPIRHHPIVSPPNSPVPLCPPPYTPRVPSLCPPLIPTCPPRVPTTPQCPPVPPPCPHDPPSPPSACSVMLRHSDSSVGLISRSVPGRGHSGGGQKKGEGGAQTS